MAETFYTALGVATDADGEAIQEAFRDRVKERHPDVSDDPGAPREFKRLTTARAVLVDDDERERYDRLGHATYVDRHLETSVWETGQANPAEQVHSTSRDGSGPGRQAGTGGGKGRDTTRTTWLGEDWEGPRGRRHADRDGSSRRGSGGSVTGRRGSPESATAGWQHASDVYRTTATPKSTGGSSVSGLLRTFAGTVGPWLVVHLVFVLTAIGTAWYAYASVGVVGQLSIPGIAFGVVLVCLVAFLSAMHVVSLVYG